MKNIPGVSSPRGHSRGRFIDQFEVLLLDMGGTFMFDVDRFNAGDGLYTTYLKFGGGRLGSGAVYRILSDVFRELVADGRVPGNYEQIRPVSNYLERHPSAASLPPEELALLEKVFAEHEVGTIPDKYVEIIKQLSLTHRLGIISDIWSHSGRFYRELNARGAGGFFDVIVFSSDLGIIKPSPKIFLEAVKALGTDISEVVYIGDSFRRDVTGAKNAGIPAIWIAGESDAAPDGAPDQPDLVITDLQDILENNRMDKKSKVMVAGHLCLDITPKFAGTEKPDLGKIFAPGRLTNVEGAVLSPGGVVFNTGMALDKLGTEVVLNGKVGDDVFGDIIRETVGAQRAKSFRRVAGQGTSYSIVMSPPGIDRFVLHNPATNDSFCPEDIDYGLAGECALFHFGYPPLMKRMYEKDGAELAEIFMRVKGLGVITSLDMAMPDPNSGPGQVNWQKILENVLPFTDIFVPSIEEISFMLYPALFYERKEQAGDTDPVSVYSPRDCEMISARLLQMGARVILIKCGEKGLYLRTAPFDRMDSMSPSFPMDMGAWANREMWAGAYKPGSFRSALGAGDATVAGFLNAILKSYPAQEALQIACALGWQNIQAVDALSGIKDWATTLEIMKDKERPRNLPGTGTGNWQFSAKKQVYYGPGDKEWK